MTINKINRLVRNSDLKWISEVRDENNWIEKYPHSTCLGNHWVRDEALYKWVFALLNFGIGTSGKRVIDLGVQNGCVPHVVADWGNETTALDIKNSIDKLVNQLKNEFTEIVANHKLVSDKKNFVFEHGNETYAISQTQRDILNQSEVKKLLTSKKIAIPYKTSTSVSIKNISGVGVNVDNELIKMLKVGNNA